jgi:hypothetical protein
MEQRREQLLEEIRIAERARDLLAELERHLKERDRSDLEEHLGSWSGWPGPFRRPTPCGCWPSPPSGPPGFAARAMPVPPRAGPARRRRGGSRRSVGCSPARMRSRAWTRSATGGGEGGPARPEGRSQGHGPRPLGVGRGACGLEGRRYPLANRPGIRCPSVPPGGRARSRGGACGGA